MKRLSFGKVSFRQLEPEDLEILYRWENDPALWVVGNTFVPFSRYVLKQYISESHRDIYEVRQLRLMILDMDDKAVGAVDLFDFEPFHQRAGVGILIYELADRRKGLALDALNLLSLYARETLGLHQLYANVAASNTPSVALFEKAGFSVAGNRKEWLKLPTGWDDAIIFQKIL